MAGNCLPYHWPEFLATKGPRRTKGLSLLRVAHCSLLSLGWRIDRTLRVNTMHSLSHPPGLADDRCLGKSTGWFPPWGVKIGALTCGMSLLWYCAYIGKWSCGLGAVAFIHSGMPSGMVSGGVGAIPWRLQTTVYLSPFLLGPYATQLVPWCGTLLWPDCTWSEALVQNFHLCVTCHRHMGRSWDPPLMLTGLCERSYLVDTDRCFLEIASWWMLCFLSRESFKQTVQTVQGPLVVSEVIVFGRHRKGGTGSSYLAILTASPSLV